MSKFQFYVVNAFTDKAFGGNPAGVVSVDEFPSSQSLKQIVSESRLPEVSFIRPRQTGGYDIRWFTSEVELDLCGHGTVGAAHAVFQHLDTNLSTVAFHTEQQTITVDRVGQQYQMTMPKMAVTPSNHLAAIEAAIGTGVKALYQGRSYLAWIDNEDELVRLSPDIDKLMALDLPGVIIVAPGNTLDYVCRYFAPQKGIYEDAVTGTANATIATQLAQTTGQRQFEAAQLSKRKGTLSLRVDERGVTMTCCAFTAFESVMFINE
jgi:PhzF family phenazine biosynthesis protein